MKCSRIIGQSDRVYPKRLRRCENGETPDFLSDQSKAKVAIVALGGDKIVQEIEAMHHLPQ